MHPSALGSTRQYANIAYTTCSQRRRARPSSTHSENKTGTAYIYKAHCAIARGERAEQSVGKKGTEPPGMREEGDGTGMRSDEQEKGGVEQMQSRTACVTTYTTYRAPRSADTLPRIKNIVLPGAARCGGIANTARVRPEAVRICKSVEGAAQNGWARSRGA